MAALTPNPASSFRPRLAALAVLLALVAVPSFAAGNVLPSSPCPQSMKCSVNLTLGDPCKGVPTPAMTSAEVIGSECFQACPDGQVGGVVDGVSVCRSIPAVSICELPSVLDSGTSGESDPCLASCPPGRSGAVVDGVPLCIEPPVPPCPPGTPGCTDGPCLIGPACLLGGDPPPGCWAASANHWWAAHAECTWDCPAEALIIVEAAAGVLGVPKSVHGKTSACHAECDSEVGSPKGDGIVCVGAGRTGNLPVLQATCEGDADGVGVVNVIVVCAAPQCGAPCGLRATGKTISVSPTLDWSSVMPGDQVCIPGGAGSCVTMMPNSIITFQGPDIGQGAARCTAVDCRGSADAP